MELHGGQRPALRLATETDDKRLSPTLTDDDKDGAMAQETVNKRSKSSTIEVAETDTIPGRPASLPFEVMEQ